ncbi:hypothetical protein VTK73DRAFT_1262 [Phialemonium thermophilum]|uniref:Uncharacterized protein n=1 Tax=Phialemonium thermophilum TaxID=223376 RepID=A0ABR3Y4F4_9PEZI
MPPTLDLSRTKHAKTIVSRPRINLRRATSYNQDRGPLSSSSSRFNFNHLLFSPPPSPGLPALAPPAKKPVRLNRLVRPSRLLRVFLYIVTIFLIIYFALVAVHRTLDIPTSHGLDPSHGAETSIGRLPDSPAPIITKDRRGRTRWTVWIPPTQEFPLPTSQYADICAQCRKVSSTVQALGSSHSFPHTLLPFASEPEDPNFIDVQEAQKEGLVPQHGATEQDIAEDKHDVEGPGSVSGRTEGTPVCKTSITFVLEPEEAGLGKTLMMLWTAYGLAQKEGRAFFIDDSQWAYGKYADIFQPPPPLDCRAPPRREILPCPRQARHLVVSTANAADVFGITTNGSSTIEPSSSSDQEKEFRLARKGYETLFRLNMDDASYVKSRVAHIKSQRVMSTAKGEKNGMIIGMHIRRGDRHPWEYQYRYSYIPTNVYIDAARKVEKERHRHGRLGKEDGPSLRERSTLIVASDDPMVYETDEFLSANRAQERIKLANKVTAQPANPDRRVMRKFVDETFGWEGGFFAAMFWNLGQPSLSAAASAENVRTRLPSDDVLRLRSLVGRAYMMDLAVLADVSDAVICTVSATGCRLLAVMMGWERTMEKGDWVNVDGPFTWSGVSL